MTPEPGPAFRQRLVAPFLLLALGLAAPSVAQTPPPSQPTGIELVHVSGQTFVTWDEVGGEDESYRIYRSHNLIDDVTRPRVTFLAEVWKDSAEFYADRYKRSNCGDGDPYPSRFSKRLVVPGPSIHGGAQSIPAAVPEGRGLLVWTPSARELGNKCSGLGDPDCSRRIYYAVTRVTASGYENPLGVLGSNVAAVDETLAEPAPVDMTLALRANPPYVDSAGISIPRTQSGGTFLPPPQGVHVFIQYMDLHVWNSTFHAPNPSNGWWGEDPGEIKIRNGSQYAYAYTVTEPNPILGCPDPVSSGTTWPVVVSLHQKAGNRIQVGMTYRRQSGCAVRINPIDVSDTWWFGFADSSHDYRDDSVPCLDTGAGLAPSTGHIVNYTELRLLRMVYDLFRSTRFADRVDPDRVYVKGHSMGGSGAISLAMRYPEVFAAAASSKGMTDFRDFVEVGTVNNPDYRLDLADRWGHVATNLPMRFLGPADWTDHLTAIQPAPSVWDWQDHILQLTTRMSAEMAPLITTHGICDSTIPHATQGAPFVSAMESAKRIWGGLLDCTTHSGSAPQAGAPPGLTTASGGRRFADYGICRDESVPAFSNLVPSNPPPPGAPCNPCSTSMSCSPCNPAMYFGGLEWSSSWNNWRGTPVDTPTRWETSLRWTAPGGSAALVDVTPRRLQEMRFDFANHVYLWKNVDNNTGHTVPGQRGVLVPDPIDGLPTVHGFLVTSGAGNRLVISEQH